MVRTMSAGAAALCLALTVWVLPSGAAVKNHPLPPAQEQLSGVLPDAVNRRAIPGGMPLRVMNRKSVLVGTADNQKQWRARAGLMQDDMAALRACMDEPASCADDSIRRWAILARAARALEGMEQLAFINRRINDLIAYQSDYDRFGMRDYWAAPSQTIGATGDCEDYVLAKYWTLRALGIPADALRLVVLKNTVLGSYHAVLQLRSENGEEILLSNLQDALQRARDIPHYRPLYSMNENWKWIHPKAPAPARMIAQANADQDPVRAEYGSM